MNYFVDPSAQLGEDVRVGHFSVIEADVRIGNRVDIGHGVVIRKGTIIGDDCEIADNTVIGKHPTVASTSTLKKRGDLTEATLPPLAIGKTVTVGACVVLYAGTIIEDGVFVADLASVREHCRIGRKAIIGRGVTVENQCEIGEFTKIQAEAYITALSKVGDRVFIAPTVSTTNDNFMGRTEERFKHRKGATIKSRARIGGGAVLLPGVIIGEEAMVGAGAVVTRDRAGLQGGLRKSSPRAAGHPVGAGSRARPGGRKLEGADAREPDSHGRPEGSVQDDRGARPGGGAPCTFRGRLHQRSGREGDGEGVRGFPRRLPFHRVRQRHRRAAHCLPRAGHRPRRRGHHHGLHLRGHRGHRLADRSHSGVRRHRPRDVQHRSGGHRGRHHAPHQGHRARATCSAAPPTWMPSWTSPASTTWPWSRTAPSPPGPPSRAA